MKTELYDFLLRHQARHPISFHMPGHKSNEDLYRNYGYGEFLDSFLSCDITEIEGADNLFQPETVLRSLQDNYAQFYGVKQAWALINGTSAGILAAVMAAVPSGGKLILARNCHKSVYNALRLANAAPVYLYPEILFDENIAGGISPAQVERALKENPDASAVILPSPNYYGICSDIRKIADVVHQHGKILIVDEAHGAHLKLFAGRKIPGVGSMPAAAEDSGADLIVASTHKTLASLTQSAVLLCNSNRIDPALLEDRLQMIESTSPSYLLMTSLELSLALLTEHGRELTGQWASNLSRFYEEAGSIPGLQLMRSPKRLDFTKLNLSLSAKGLSGPELDAALREEGIFTELSVDSIAMAMTGIGNRDSDYTALLEALQKISAQGHNIPCAPDDTVSSSDTPVLPGTKFVRIPKASEAVPLAQAAGRISASMLIPYPPGIPTVCPGEIITEEVIQVLTAFRQQGKKVLGVSQDLMIRVGK